MAADALSDVLKTVRMTGAIFFSVTAKEPWVAEQLSRETVLPMILPGAEHMIAFHIVTEGRCFAHMIGGPAIELSAGDANASNIAMQMVDPWPRYAGNKNIASNGQRMQAAVERYRNNQVTSPQGISASTTYGAQSNPNSASPANNNSPVGPTVAGSVK